MHQYAYAAQYARSFGIDLLLPSEWEGSRLFAARPYRVIEDDELRLLLNQTQQAYDNLEARQRAVAAYNERTGNTFEYADPDDARMTWSGRQSVFIDSLCAYNQHIFDGMSGRYLRQHLFVFGEEVHRSDAYKRWADRQGTYDIAHLRRDDVADPHYNRTNVQGYSVLSMRSYRRAFREFGVDGDKVEWVSDDYLGLWHRDRAPTPRGGWTYPVGSEYMGPGLVFDWLEDFLKLYFARTIFRANSSFSWWAAFLSPTARVYSPVMDKQVIYGRDSFQEVDCEFVEGNHPHWMYGCEDIHLQEGMATAEGCGP